VLAQSVGRIALFLTLALPRGERFATSVSTLHMLIQLILGKDVKLSIGKFKEGLYMLRHADDFFLDEQESKGKI